MNIFKINTIDDARVQKFFRLTEAQLRPASFIAESPNVIMRALENGFEPEALLCEERLLGGIAADGMSAEISAADGISAADSEAGHSGTAAQVLQALGDVPVYTAPKEILSQITGYNLIRGMMCAFRRPEPRSAETVCGSAPSNPVILSEAKNLPRRIAVLDGVVDAANVGAIFRSAAALGMEAVLLHSSCDPFNRRAVRSSMGAVFQVPWAVLDAGENAAGGDAGDIGTMEALRRLGFKTVAMALRNDSILLDSSTLAAEPHLAIVLGNEGNGLPAEEIAAADYVVRIPMAHGVDSLSVTSAAAIAFWQLR